MNIYDYIDYYKDVSLNEVPWNIMDNLMCALLVYAPLNNFKYKYFDEIVSDIKKIRIKPKSNATIPMVKEMINHLNKSERYKDISFMNMVKITNDKTQFGALTIKIGDTKVISFEGSDGSSVGWLENFRCLYEYPTFTQKLALEYLNNNITEEDKKVYVLGHSKGGNMAMSAAMETPLDKFNKIEKVINFDGPGFRKEEYNSEKYKRLSSKLTNILPSGSLVGTLLYNENYTFISTLTNGASEHYPVNWKTYGQFFIKEEQTNISKQLHIKTTVGIEQIDMENAKYTTELIFDALMKEKKNLYEIKPSDIISIYKNIKNIDSNTFDYIFSIISTVFTSTKKLS